MLSKTKKRCNYFYPSGASRDPPCPRPSTCRYIHPDDPEWDYLPPTYPPDSPRKSSFSSRHDSDREMRHSRPSPSSPSHSRRPRSTSQSRHGPTRHRDNESTHSEARVSTQPRPPSPLAPPPRSTPPPPPPVPSVISTATKHSVESMEPSTEEKVGLWNKRISLVSGAVRHHAELAKLGEEEQSLRQTMSTRYYEGLPEKDKYDHTKRLGALEKRREIVQRTIQDQVHQLLQSDAWPVGRATQSPACPHQDIMKFIDELKGTASEIHKLLGSISTTMATSRAQAPQTSHVEGPPAKRRRLSDTEEERAEPSTSTSTSLGLAKLTDKLHAIEQRLGVVENDFNALANDLNTEVIEMSSSLETRLKEIRNSWPTDDLSQKLRGVSDKVETASTELEEFKQYVTDLSVGAESIDEGMAHLTETLRQLVLPDETEIKLAQFNDPNTKDLEELEALRAAVSAHVSQSSPPLSVSVDADVLLQAFEGVLTESIRRKVVTPLEEMQSKVSEELQRRNDEIQLMFNKKFALIQRVLETVEKRLTHP